MTHVLCQLVSYPFLEEEDELGVREISSTTIDTSYPLTKDVMDDVSSYDGDIDQM